MKLLKKLPLKFESSSEAGGKKPKPEPEVFSRLFAQHQQKPNSILVLFYCIAFSFDSTNNDLFCKLHLFLQTKSETRSRITAKHQLTKQVPYSILLLQSLLLYTQVCIFSIILVNFTRFSWLKTVQFSPNCTVAI